MMYGYFYHFHDRPLGENLYYRSFSPESPILPIDDERITEDGSVRITEAGIVRIIE